MPVLKFQSGLGPELITSLRGVRRTEQENFVAVLRDPGNLAQLADDKVFVNLIQLALRDYGVRQSALAQRLGASTAQVGRWRANKSAPPVYSRGMIIDTLADALEAELASREAVPEDSDPPESGEVPRPTIATLGDTAALEIGREAGRVARRRARAAGVPVAVMEGDEIKLIEAD